MLKKLIQMENKHKYDIIHTEVEEHDDDGEI